MCYQKVEFPFLNFKDIHVFYSYMSIQAEGSQCVQLFQYDVEDAFVCELRDVLVVVAEVEVL
jgi:hypothetical protein